MAKVEWDYSKLAKHYDRRADYSTEALVKALGAMALTPSIPVADLGAGTGKLTTQLLKHGLTVLAVEPNDEMRRFGIGNTTGQAATWRDGTGEVTGLADRSVAAAFFGSSFNVVDQAAALEECRRILIPEGWFCCMWNHRDLTDALQSEIEGIIRSHIPDYNYGTRREDPTDVIGASELFGPVTGISQSFVVEMTREDIVEAWGSHATLQRQAGSQFESIVAEIEELVRRQPVYSVPYTTNLWFSRGLA
jgi:SAM-dependent methyltransferase